MAETFNNSTPLNTRLAEPGLTPDEITDIVENSNDLPDLDNTILGRGLTIGSRGYNIYTTSTDIIRRIPFNELWDYEDIKDIVDTTIWELLPRPKELPTDPPISGKVYVGNWSRVLNFGGITDPSKSPVINKIEDWVEFDSNDNPRPQNEAGNWMQGHKWPKDYTLDPTYLFFTGDPPLFYVQNAISYINKGVNVPVDDQDIVWFLEGKEIHRGWYLQLEGLSETVTTQNGIGVMIPKRLEVEIRNKAGVRREEIKYSAINPENAALSTLAPDLSNQDENFTTTTQGRFEVDDEKREVVWQDDPRYKPREIYLRFQWKDLGKGESPIRKFKKEKCKVKIDSEVVFNNDCLKLDGQRSAVGEFIDDYMAPAGAIVGGLAGLAAGVLFSGVTAGLGYGLFAATSGAILANKGKFLDIFNDKGDILDDDRPLAERGVTDWTAKGGGSRPSALLYTDEDDDEWNTLIETKKGPGGFTIEVEHDFTYRTGFLNMGKKYRRTYYLKHTISASEFDLEVPLQPIDMGLFTIPYTDERV